MALLARAGFDQPAMLQWHREFERDDSAGHAAFLESLGLEESEIAAIRREANPGPDTHDSPGR